MQQKNAGSERERFLADVIAGLSRLQKELFPKYFYDERGSSLYESICALDEYYIPGTETAVMQANIAEIVGLLGKNVLLIEYGCGSCAKTRILIENMPDLAAYIPIDISREQLRQVAEELQSDYPSLEIVPVCADYTRKFTLPVPERQYDRRVVYYPGSTIGNFTPLAAGRFLEGIIADTCGKNGALLIGVDLKKDPAVLYDAYNDREGVTAAFNLNILERINRELGADFKLESFQHRALYNDAASRIEMHLVSLKEQSVRIDNRVFSFSKGETIWTESSYKYELEEFRKLATDVGFKVEKVWTDQRNWFSVQYLTARV